MSSLDRYSLLCIAIPELREHIICACGLPEFCLSSNLWSSKATSRAAARCERSDGFLTSSMYECNQRLYKRAAMCNVDGMHVDIMHCCILEHLLVALKLHGVNSKELWG